jgi:AraC family transcriptional regulator
MNPKIIQISETLVVGVKKRMSLAEDATFLLWSSFMPRRKEITQTVNSSFISMTVYDSNFNINQFTPHTQFDKWACVEISSSESLPNDFETYTIPAGTYAVFVFKGLPQMAPQFFQKIFMEWLPKSGYNLADGPHFAVMGEKYKNNDPESEEEIYIPLTAGF